MGEVKAVWIVQQDETPDNTILGVFESEADARDYVEEIHHQFTKGVFYSSFPIGYRFDEGSQRYSS
jgi:hypothetical protein